jgi:hypothetical protein
LVERAAPLTQGCQYRLKKPDKTNGQLCDDEFTDVDQPGKHMQNHQRQMRTKNADGSWSFTCIFGSCADGPTDTMVTFDTLLEQVDHFWSVHKVPREKFAVRGEVVH